MMYRATGSTAQRRNPRRAPRGNAAGLESAKRPPSRLRLLDYTAEPRRRPMILVRRRRPSPAGDGYCASMGISAHLARLRAVIGHELIQLPSVSVIVVDDQGRLLLVRHAGSQDGWAVPGGAVDLGESPAHAAVREIREETGLEISRLRLLDVLGGADFEVLYPNGDRVAYVTAVYQAGIAGGSPVPDPEEISELGWFAPAELAATDLNRFARALLRATGHLAT
jgi:ADP-ribose pyrophosphatase YjhB (NUDIX family)